jgi:hypothetical protein
MSVETPNGAHEHDHNGSHTHEHPAVAENYSARKHPEFVVMNIGAGLGGLIVHADPELHGEEIEISVAGDDDTRTHKDVLERSAGGRPAFTAVFDGLPAGRYTLWSRNEPRARELEIIGATVVELDWRTAAQ